MTNVKHYDVLVLGGGSGLTAAYHAKRAGKSVALIEGNANALGGTCVNRGCIPTKGLIQAAEILKTIDSGRQFGVHVPRESVKIDFSQIMETVRQRRAEDANDVKGWVDSAFDPFYQRCRFIGEKTVELEDGRQVRGEKVFIATGAQPAIPPVPGLESVEYWTNESILELQHQPKTLLVLGGGYIGCEFGHFFSSLGTEVTLIDRGECLLAEDEDIQACFTREFAKQVHLIQKAHAKEVHQQQDGQIGLVIEEADGNRRTILADGILVATGRRPNTDDLGLEQTGVKSTPNGWIEVDKTLRASHPDIYAYGDVIGQAMFKHTSSYEGELAFRNSQGEELEVSYLANPHAVFSHPQIGSVGLREKDCSKQGLKYRVAKQDYEEVAKGRIIGSPPGLAKVLVEEGTDRILGFHMIGPQAADLIHEVVVAMNAHNGEAKLIRDTIHVHPTLSELIKRTFDALS